MNFLDTHLLTLILFIPSLVALLLLLLPSQNLRLLRGFALFASLIPLVFSIYLWLHFYPDKAGFQFEISYL